MQGSEGLLCDIDLFTQEEKIAVSMLMFAGSRAGCRFNLFLVLCDVFFFGKKKKERDSLFFSTR